MAKQTSDPVTPTPVITIDAAEISNIPVRLVGRDYLIVPPKAALAMTMANAPEGDGEQTMQRVSTMLREWITIAFVDDSEEIFDRLNDPKDKLDIPHITSLMGKVMEASARGNPTM